MATDVLVDVDELASRAEQRGRMEAAGLIEGTLCRAEQIREGENHASGDQRSRRDRVRAECHLVDRGLAADATRRRRDEMPLGHLCVVERARQPNGDRVVRLAQHADVPATRPEHLLALEQTLGTKEPDRKLRFEAGRPHRHRDGDRVLVRPGGPDLEWRLADDPVVADFDRLAAHGDDLAAGDLARGRASRARRRRAAGTIGCHPGHRVLTSSWLNLVNASVATFAASAALPSAANPARPVVPAQSTKSDAAV